jgi:hypothetical protein
MTKWGRIVQAHCPMGRPLESSARKSRPNRHIAERFSSCGLSGYHIVHLKVRFGFLVISLRLRHGMRVNGKAPKTFGEG